MFYMSRGFWVCFVAFVTHFIAGGAPAPVEDSRLCPQHRHQLDGQDFEQFASRFGRGEVKMQPSGWHKIIQTNFSWLKENWLRNWFVFLKGTLAAARLSNTNVQNAMGEENS